MIGFLLGTCIAFFVVMGDLAPAIISEIAGTETSSAMRTSILMALALFCVLPLGLLRNIDSLSGVSSATIGFYFFLVLMIIVEALPHFFLGDWVYKVELWRPAGILQCLPIFSMALSCQTQLFEIYQIMYNPTLEKMNYVVKIAVHICTLVYFFVGSFGYIAFVHKPFTGNILLSFAPSYITHVMKIGFIMSIAFSFPLVIFPCRGSLYSLLYREGYSVHESMSNYIPEGKFKGLTLFIVFTSLLLGILMPNIELVLGLVGSTIGIIICLLFPVICFICVSQKNTNERLVAKFVVVIGIFLMILGTYKNLQDFDKVDSPTVENVLSERKPLLSFSMIEPINNAVTDIQRKYNLTKVTESPEVRHEPPQPIESFEHKSHDNKNLNKKLPTENMLKVEKIVKGKNNLIKSEKGLHKNENSNITIEAKNEEVDIEAIKKDDNEMKLQNKEDSHRILIDTLQKQNRVQEQIMKQQKKLIEVIEKQQKSVNDEVKVNEEKLKAVKEIESIALQAIERISGNDDVSKKLSEVLENRVNIVMNRTISESDTKIQKKIKPFSKDYVNTSSDSLLKKKVSNSSLFVKSGKREVRKEMAPLFINLGAKSNSSNLIKEIPVTGKLMHNISLLNSKDSVNVTKISVTVDDPLVVRRDILSYSDKRK
ncbi:putative sodium-coupled neutral amino acid transporter 10 [Cylas formicarius]|uniref:putative sodium-coupled neutral amino acid transporter 10 n=1 Tax=Cylas formicarius TaxID=197179 RepID=UPI0029588D49|nr:putative sodium-coupled neutral amino acid transporter 10 [Cylas formicarius]